MSPETIAAQVLEHCAERTPIELTPQQSRFWGCMLTAALSALPTFISALTRCLAETPNPPAGDYNPGNRSRCQ